MEKHTYEVFKNVCDGFFCAFLVIHLNTVNVVQAEGTCQKDIPEPIIFSRPGNLTLSYIGQFTWSTIGVCKNRLPDNSLQFPDLFAYAVREVNRRKDILPNVTLGFTVMDGCLLGTVNLARVWTLLMENCHGCSSGGSGGSGTHVFAEDSGKLIGMVGPFTSYQSVVMSGSLGIHHIPHLALMATSDELSDKSRYEYFQRMVPPDHYQTDIILDVAEYFNWRYFSFIFAEGNYGENAAKQITRKATERGLCIGYSLMYASHHKKEDLKKAVQEILKNPHNRLIIVMLFSDEFRLLVNAIVELGAIEHFIFLGGDATCSTERNSEHVPIGLLCISFETLELPDFAEHYMAADPLAADSSPWMPLLWEAYLECSWMVNATVPCHNLSLTAVEKDIHIKSRYAYKIYEGVFVFAYALHNLITDNCPEVFQDGTGLDECVEGALVLKYMRNVSFQGVSGDVKFDANGDMISGYILAQLEIDNEGKEQFKTVGDWLLSRTSGNKLKIFDDVISFSSKNVSQEGEIPTSVCSLPCPDKQYYHYEENRCCWKCKFCRNNEIITKNRTECTTCPEFLWPDSVYAESCVELGVTVLGPDHPTGIGILVMATIGVCSSILILCILGKYRKSKLVKACSRELSTISLLGTLLAGVAAFFFVIDPTNIVCTFRRIFFHFSVTMIFTPILAKTTRVYRIFSSAQKGQHRPKFISPKAQVVITAIQLFIQAVLLLCTNFVSPPLGVLRMPVPTEDYVERHCTQALWAFLVPLTFNILVLIMCAVFGFLTRKLPENFNESWFIFLSVAATLLMWSLLLPTYFTAFYAYHRAVILAYCLLVNVFLILGCQYGTKMYALLWVGEENILVGNFATNTQVSVITNQTVH